MRDINDYLDKVFKEHGYNQPWQTYFSKWGDNPVQNLLLKAIVSYIEFLGKEPHDP